MPMVVRSASVRRFARCGAVVGLCLLAPPAAGQQDSPAPPDTVVAADTSWATLLSTNPTGRLLEPRKTQTVEQQLADQLDCYLWTCAQTDWDPYEAYDALIARGYTVPMTDRELETLLVDQAARGAVTGTAAGSIAGIPGVGARLGAAIAIAQAMHEAGYLDVTDDPDAQRAVARFESDLGKWNAKYSGCMVRKGYRVSSP